MVTAHVTRTSAGSAAMNFSTRANTPSSPLVFQASVTHDEYKTRVSRKKF